MKQKKKECEGKWREHMLGGSTLYQQIERNLVFKVTGREVFCCTNQNQRNLVFAEEVSG
jgi:hypothetical protein